MGIQMDDIHTPTVPSGPVSGSGPVESSASKASMTELSGEKKRLEAELKILGSVLESHGVDMKTSLITEDGFPRADLDIAQIRTTRSRIIRLRNDYKAIMLKIEEGLAAYFAETKDMKRDPSDAIPLSLWARTPNADGSVTLKAEEAALELSFAKVKGVVDGSPAAKAGLKAGDRVCSFGHIVLLGQNHLSRVAELVSQSVEMPILVEVARSDAGGEVRMYRVNVTPTRDWGGKGLLGCHLVL